MMSTDIPKPSNRPPMPQVLPPRCNGKMYSQACLLLQDYKRGIYTTEEVARLIFKLFRKV